jgi:hypothetical protein
MYSRENPLYLYNFPLLIRYAYSNILPKFFFPLGICYIYINFLTYGNTTLSTRRRLNAHQKPTKIPSKLAIFILLLIWSQSLPDYITVQLRKKKKYHFYVALNVGQFYEQ